MPKTSEMRKVMESIETSSKKTNAKGAWPHLTYVDYDAAWRKVAVKFYGYKGINAFGIDFGDKSKKHRRQGRR